MCTSASIERCVCIIMCTSASIERCVCSIMCTSASIERCVCSIMCTSASIEIEGLNNTANKYSQYMKYPELWTRLPVREWVAGDVNHPFLGLVLRRSRDWFSGDHVIAIYILVVLLHSIKGALLGLTVASCYNKNE